MVPLHILVLVVFVALLPFSPATQQDVESLRSTVATLARQLMMQQFYQEEKLRSEGNSGLKRIRSISQGTQPYHDPSHTMASVHDHPNYRDTVGFGELQVVLNGVEFHTRHNDYKLNRPSVNSTSYHKTDQIPFPAVPPEVLQCDTVREQIEEMSAWFKAWRDQDHSVRDYRPYFKPILCYLEGAWTLPGENITEPFDAVSHFLDAVTWRELQDNVRFMSHTGHKDAEGNFAFLPTAIYDQVDGIPKIAQWNYRILCHPLNRDLPLNRLRPVNDLGVRMTYQRTQEQHAVKRGARFRLSPEDTDDFVDGRANYGLLDELMAEIPGKDNYPGYLEDHAFSETAHKYVPDVHNGSIVDVPLNTAYYHRWYKVAGMGPTRLVSRCRGYSDEMLFMAMTSSPNVAPSKVRMCNKNRTWCRKLEQRWTYAFPLEIIYLTPLHRWNPLNIAYHGNASLTEGRIVTADGRRGRRNEDALNGTNSRLFYRTPAQFFFTNDAGSDPTGMVFKKDVKVLNREGNVCATRASGVRIFMDIPRVGVVRTRYPIMPIHGEGDPVWKELAALKDAMLDPEAYSHMFPESHPFHREDVQPPTGSNFTNSSQDGIHLLVGPSSPEPSGVHTHFVDLSEAEAARLVNGPVVAVTSASAGHTHSVKLKCKRVQAGRCAAVVMLKCDGLVRCFDNHPRWMRIIDSQEEEDTDTDI